MTTGPLSDTEQHKIAECAQTLGMVLDSMSDLVAMLDTDGRLIRPPLAVIVEFDENGAEIASPAAAQPVASPVSAFRRRASGGAAESAADDKKES